MYTKNNYNTSFHSDMLDWSTTQLYMFHVMPTPEKRYDFAKKLYNDVYKDNIPEDILEEFKPKECQL